jgi:hypothetical protein
MTVFRKFEVCASYESSVVKSPPSPSRKPLWAMLFDDRADIKRQDLNQTDDNNLDQWTDI